MKKILTGLSLVVVMASCKNTPTANTSSAPTEKDTVVIKQPTVVKEVHYVNSSTSSNPAQAQPAAKKKGWSKAAKGTAIGAGSGAVVGALVSKKKGKGAVIGGVVGAGAGYLIGRDQDKKDGRVKQ